MGVSQDDFSYFRGTAYAGMIVDGTPFRTEALTLESGELGFGDPSIGGSDDNSCVPFTGDFQENINIFTGVSVRHFRQNSNPIGATETRAFAAGSTVDVMTFGRIYVRVEEEVNRGEKAILDTSNKWYGDRKDAANADTLFLVTGATYKTSALAGELAQLQLNGGTELISKPAV